MAGKPNTNVAALAAALHTFLGKRGGAYGFSVGGYFSGNVKDLFPHLIRDFTYYQVSARPHDAAGLRAALKKHANELHELGVIVTLQDLGIVMLGVAEKSKSK